MLEVEIQKQLDSFTLDIAFQAKKGITAILGPSGCGKSLTLQCLAGIQAPNTGKIVLHGRTLFNSQHKSIVKTRYRNIGYVFQNYALFPHLTVEENIAFGLKKIHKKAENKKRVADMLNKIQLTGYKKYFPRQLSGGQQQRVALGRTLITNPDLLLLDEPFSALDHHVKHLLEQELLAIIQENFSGVALLVTHNMEEAYRLADSILLLKEGKVIQSGDKHELFQRPQSVAAAQIIGCQNILPLDSLIANNEQLEIRSQGVKLIVEKTAIIENPTHVGIHADNIEFVNETPDEAAGNTFDFEVTEMITGINQTQLTVKIGNLLVKAMVLNNRLNVVLASRKVYLPANHLFLLTP